MLWEDKAFVTVSDDSFRGGGGEPFSFVGCVSASRVRSHALFPSYAFEQGAVLLSNLCVSNEYRGQGVGRELVERVLSSAKEVSGPSPIVYLLISRTGMQSSDPKIASEFENRVERLEETYRRLSFRPVATQRLATLMRWGEK